MHHLAVPGAPCAVRTSTSVASGRADSASDVVRAARLRMPMTNSSVLPCTCRSYPLQPSLPHAPHQSRVTDTHPPLSFPQHTPSLLSHHLQLPFSPPPFLPAPGTALLYHPPRSLRPVRY
eukprot:1839521-Rhodomonas_salina.3